MKTGIATLWELWAVEWRVLGPWRCIRDNIYYAYCMGLLSLPFGLWLMLHTPLLNGCRGYFEWRDSIEFPIIGRWYSRRWLIEQRRRRAAFAARYGA